MAERIEFEWKKPFVVRDKLNGDKPIETFPEDKLDRVKYANFLTQFLAGQGYDKAKKEKRNYVLNLNSEWGSGKTYFLRRWAEDLKEHYPVVYVDAWKQDYSDDPLMTVISSMISQLRAQAGKDADDPVFKAPRKLMGLLKAAAPSVIGGVTKRFFGIDPVAIMRAAEDDEVAELDENGETVKDENGKPIDMGAAASKMVQHLINEHDAKAETIESLKLSVEQWVGAVIGKEQEKGAGEPKRTYPAFVFIDELDRCRPSYAVEMLETIKHIFNIPGVVFVVATDTEQLQHAVKAVYGEGFNARVYLGRFFNSRFSLKSPSYENLLETHCRTHLLEKEYLKSIGNDIWNVSDKLEDTLDNITAVLDSFDISVRSAIQVTDRLIATVSDQTLNTKVDLISLLIFYCIREVNEQVYNVIAKGDFDSTKKREEVSLVNDFNLNLAKDGDNELFLYVEPHSIVANLQMKQGMVANSYPSEDYACTVAQYYKSITQRIYSKPRLAEGSYKSYADRGYTHARMGDLSSSLGITLKEKRQQPIGIQWIEYSYLHEQVGVKATIDVYKDLVELASALDWIDGEEEE